MLLFITKNCSGAAAACSRAVAAHNRPAAARGRTAAALGGAEDAYWGLQLLLAGLRMLAGGYSYFWQGWGCLLGTTAAPGRVRMLAGGYSCSWQGCGCNCRRIRSHLAAEWAARWGRGEWGDTSFDLFSCFPFLSFFLLFAFLGLLLLLALYTGTSMNIERIFLSPPPPHQSLRQYYGLKPCQTLPVEIQQLGGVSRVGVSHLRGGKVVGKNSHGLTVATGYVCIFGFMLTKHLSGYPVSGRISVKNESDIRSNSKKYFPVIIDTQWKP